MIRKWKHNTAVNHRYTTEQQRAMRSRAGLLAGESGGVGYEEMLIGYRVGTSGRGDFNNPLKYDRVEVVAKETQFFGAGREP